jgi:hypothetical protein
LIRCHIDEGHIDEEGISVAQSKAGSDDYILSQQLECFINPDLTPFLNNAYTYICAIAVLIITQHAAVVVYINVMVAIMWSFFCILHQILCNNHFFAIM